MIPPFASFSIFTMFGIVQVWTTLGCFRIHFINKHTLFESILFNISIVVTARSSAELIHYLI